MEPAREADVDPAREMELARETEPEAERDSDPMENENEPERRPNELLPEKSMSLLFLSTIMPTLGWGLKYAAALLIELATLLKVEVADESLLLAVEETEMERVCECVEECVFVVEASDTEEAREMEEAEET